MTITLDPQIEAAVFSKASAYGMPVDKYVGELLRRELGLPETRHLSEGEVDCFFGELRLLSSGVETIADRNFTRETIYQDHD